MTAKAISFTPDVLKAKLRALAAYGLVQARRPVRCNPVYGRRPSLRPVANVGSKWVEGRLWVEPGGWVAPPMGIVGQVLWVRERALVLKVCGPSEALSVLLRYEDGGKSEWLPYPSRLKPPRDGHRIPHGVFREGARHFLEVVEVRAERVAEISDSDAELEGVERLIDENGWRNYGPDDLPGESIQYWATARESFFSLYDSIYGNGAYARDWCWVYTLKRAEM